MFFLIFRFRFLRGLLQAWERCSRCCARTTRTLVRRRVVRSAATRGVQADGSVDRRTEATTARPATVRPGKSYFRTRLRFYPSLVTWASSTWGYPTNSRENSDADSAARVIAGRARCAVTRWSSAAENRRLFSARNARTRRDSEEI